MGDNLIVKDNDIVKASYQLTANEQRLILSAISKIPKGKPVSDREIYPIYAEDFIELGVHRKTAYREMNKAIDSLYEKNISIKQGNTIIKSRWVQMIIKMDRDWIRDNYHFFANDYEIGDEFYVEQAFPADYCIIGIKFSEAVLPFISNLSSNFTQYLKQDIAGLSSAYAIRFYELLMQFKATGFVKITLFDLRNMLDLGNKYKATKDLRKWVIDTAIKEINEKSPVNVHYRLIKTGRRFTHLEMKFKQKPKEVTETATANRDPDTLDWVDNLTDTERKIIREQAEQYISRQGITDESYKQNIYKKALAESWGLADYQKATDEEEKRRKRLQEEKQKELERKKAEEEKRKQEQKELDECEMKFLALPQVVQNIVLETLENRLPKTFKKRFRTDLEEDSKAYRLVEYAGTFKQIMKDF